jgi:tRNA G18 (ribose-2'-O)-methylase SpoU
MIKKSMSELNRLSIEEFKQQEKNDVVVVLDNIRSMHNVGSVFRTSDAFLIKEIVLCGLTPCPPHRDIQKSALGATESVAWSYEKETTDAIDKLKQQDYKILAIEQVHNSISLSDFSKAEGAKVAFVFGNEVHGVSDEVLSRCDSCIEIPQQGSKHSFNISVSVGIVLWELTKP